MKNAFEAEKNDNVQLFGNDLVLVSGIVKKVEKRGGGVCVQFHSIRENKMYWYVEQKNGFKHIYDENVMVDEGEKPSPLGWVKEDTKFEVTGKSYS